MLDEGLILQEQIALALMVNAVALYGAAAGAEGFKAVVSFGLLGDPSSSAAQAVTTLASIFQFWASHERQKQEWRLQRNQAAQDLTIGVQQVQLAQDRVRIVAQEQRIAELQSGHAEDTMEFLANKFTSVELYDWMSGVLERTYRFFLQHATAMARLAEHQLAFERQEIPPSVIQLDYWEAPIGLVAPGSSNDDAANRRGLTGSTRLVQDVFQLDQHAFDTEKRKLQLTKTISLAQLARVEFARFQETGVLRFDTPMALFDRDTICD